MQTDVRAKKKRIDSFLENLLERKSLRRGVMEGRENHPPLLPTMTTQALPSYHHGMPLKKEDGRTVSPSILQAKQDCSISPSATSHSSTSTALSSDHPHHNTHYSMSSHPGTLHSHPPHVGVTNENEGIVQSTSWESRSSESVHLPVPSSTASNKAQKSAAGKQTKALQVTGKKRHNAKCGARVGATTEKPKGDSVTARRQKRLERNRESARLSRRRRKQYLEVLEDRVTQLSVEVDQGRRMHAARAIQTVLERRKELLENGSNEDILSIFDGPLNRSSRELSIVSTFNTQQLKSISLPAHTKFVLWLTLQGDVYFRGGRAASERLSAARIGERVSWASLLTT